jgi:hypothetical protein
MRIRIRILRLIKVMRICNHWSTDSQRLHLEPHASIMSVHDPQWHNFEPLKLLNPVMQIRIQLTKIMRLIAVPDPKTCPLHNFKGKSYVFEVILNI